nr:Ig-like domain-containing protein [Aquisphaera giovannonii]
MNVMAGTYAGFIVGWDGPGQGTYGAISGTAGKPITIQADPNASPGSVIINGRNAKTPSGIDVEGGSNYVTVNGFTINNGVGNISGYGIKVADSNYVNITNNTISHSGKTGIFTAFASFGIIQGNTSYANAEHGFYVSNSPQSVQILNNISHDNSNGGIQVNADVSMGGSGLAQNLTIAGNVIYGNGASGGGALNFDGLQNSVVRNNLLYNNRASGIALFQGDAAAGSTGNLVVNNTVIQPSGAREALNDNSSSSGNSFYNNIFLGNMDVEADSLPSAFSNNCLLVGYVNNGAYSFPSSLLSTASALFVSSAGLDFRLSSTSPAIDAGTSIGAPATDIVGSPRPSGSGYDIGAYEYQSSTPPVDTTPPTVTARAPASGATGVATSTAVTATFSEAMQAPSISTSTFALKSSSGAAVAASVSYNATTRVATLTPASALAYSTTYTATLSGPKDSAGNALAATSWSFTTAAAPDTTPPTVTARAPASGATGVATSTAVTATFSEAMQAPSISTSTFALKSSSGAAVAASVSYNATTRVATLTPASALAYSTTYTATLSGPKDSAGNALAATSWSFTTAAAPDTTPPTVTARAPASGATGVATSTAVTATFSEAMQAPSISTSTFALKSSSGAAVAASVSYNATTRVATLTPASALAYSTTYTATLSGPKDSAGNALAATSWSFTTAASPIGPGPFSIWSAAEAPVTATDPDSSATELGLKFRADVAGYITGIRFYKGSTNTGSHVGSLWNAAGTLLGRATFSSETATGWQQVVFANPVAISANTTYVASYHTNVGHYADDDYYFSGSGVTNGPLHALAAGVDGPNGVYSYGSSSTFPTKDYHSANYWVDVLFNTTATDTTPPTVSARTPGSGAVGVATPTAVTATFSEAMQAPSISTSTFALKSSSGAAVAASVSYNATTRVATLTPASALAYSTTYTATLSGPKDSAGNALAATSWSFTTAAAAPADTTPPTVSARTPGSGATGVATSTAVTATFSEAMQAPSISTSTFALKSSSGAAVAASVSYNATTRVATLTPASALAYSTTYTATLSGPKDSAGNALAATSWSFTTAAAAPADTTPPTVSARTPGSGAVGVATSTAVTATFSESVQAGTIVFTLKDNAGNALASTVAYDSSTYTATLTSSATLTASSVYTVTVSGARDLAGNQMTGSTTWSFTTASTSTAPSGSLNIPTNHQRIWWTPERIQRAKAWWAKNSFVPASDDAWGNAFAYVMTGNAQYGNAAVSLLMNFTISQSELDGVASDNYRWNDWVPVVFDWCYSAMTPSQASTFIARYNNYTSIMIGKSWGGPGMEGNNYYWGILRNELNWGLATYYENPQAQTFLNDAVVTRWQKGLLPYFAGPDQGGVAEEGSQYGRYMLQYSVVPFTTAGLMGLDLLSQTNWYKEALFNQIYNTSLSPIDGGYIGFPSNDDEASYGEPPSGDSNNGDFMTMLANEWPTSKLGQYARQWLNTVSPDRSSYVAATDAGGPATSFTDLPLDYYASGPGFLYTKNTWSPSGTSILLQLGNRSNVGHMHQDAGTFQIYAGNEQLAPEHTGYSDTFSDGSSSEDTIAHNGIVYNGRGEASNYAIGGAQILAVQSDPNFSYAAVDLSNTYQASDSRFDNTYAGHTVREFIFIKPLQTLFVVDRLESSAANVTKSFLLHMPASPTIVDANHVTMVNGSQQLRLTTLNSGHTYKVVDEGTAGSSGGRYRLQDSTSGNLDDVMLHAIQTGPAGGPAVNISIASQDANTWTITFTSASGGTATLVLNKGVFSLGGSLGYATTGTPQLAQLYGGIQGMTVTDNGPVWQSLGTRSVLASAATSASVSAESAAVNLTALPTAASEVSILNPVQSGAATAAVATGARSQTVSFVRGTHAAATSSAGGVARAGSSGSQFDGDVTIMPALSESFLDEFARQLIGSKKKRTGPGR